MLAAPACTDTNAGAGEGDALSAQEDASGLGDTSGEPDDAMGEPDEMFADAMGEPDERSQGDALADDLDVAGDPTDATSIPGDATQTADAQPEEPQDTLVASADGDVNAEEDMNAGEDVSMGEEDTAPLDPDIGCMQPTGVACSDAVPCPTELAALCVNEECHEQDFTNEHAQACCTAEYDKGNFAVAGCNPWGPPAPPAFHTEEAYA